MCSVLILSTLASHFFASENIHALNININIIFTLCKYFMILSNPVASTFLASSHAFSVELFCLSFCHWFHSIVLLSRPRSSALLILRERRAATRLTAIIIFG